MFWRRKGGKFAQPQKEPQFIAIRNDDPEMQRAHEQAAATLALFMSHVSRPGSRYRQNERQCGFHASNTRRPTLRRIRSCILSDAQAK